MMKDEKIAHAILSASSSARWLACPPSARLAAEYPAAESAYAEEGTRAHALSAAKLAALLGRQAREPTGGAEAARSGKAAASGRSNETDAALARSDAAGVDAPDEEMELCAEDYASYVLELVEAAKAACPDPLVLIEERVDYSRACGVPDAFGTADCLIVADGELTVVDFKYGKGVRVGAERNPQLLCYALGALDAFDGIYAIEHVRLAIFQPRLENISVDELSKQELVTWGADVLAPRAKLAAAGKGGFAAGDHCRFCPAKGDCRKRAEVNLELARYDFAMPDTLEDREIAALLPRLDAFVAWANDVKACALQKALGGTQFAGYKVVAGRSVRKYKDEAAVAKAVEAAGFDPYEKKLRGLTAMQRLLGKARMEELLGGLLVKPPGKPTLVPETDKRRTIDVAAEDFK